MHKYYLIFAIFWVSARADFDFELRAVLDVKCKIRGKPGVYRVVSSPQGTIVSLNGNVLFKQEQLTGGTEGADPYAQAVNNDKRINITISGGDFQKAFAKPTKLKSGVSEFALWSENAKEQEFGDCEGTFLFNSLSQSKR